MPPCIWAFLTSLGKREFFSTRLIPEFGLHHLQPPLLCRLEAKVENEYSDESWKIFSALAVEFSELGRVGALQAQPAHLELQAVPAEAQALGGPTLL